MSTKQNISCALLILAEFSISSAQPAQFDVFPLKPGFRFRYRYLAESQISSVLDGVIQARTDSGSVECIVRDSVPSGDTTLLWNVEEQQSLFHRLISWNVVDTIYWTEDTTFFTLSENRSSCHELLSSSLVWGFPVKNPATTRPVYRFSDSTAVLITESWTTNIPDCGEGRDSLWFSDTTGLIRRRSWSFYGSCHNTHTSGSTTVELVGNLTLVVREPEHLPIKAMLEQNYPNPFNPSTTIRYGLPQASHVLLTVFNILGQQVAVLVQEEQEAGYHEVKFSAEGGSASGGDGAGLASGVYFYRLQTGDFVQTRRLLLLK